MALVIATTNNSSTDDIKNLLRKVKIVPEMAFHFAIEENLQALDIFLEHDSNQVTSRHIDQAIQCNFDALNKLLACKAEAISEQNLYTAIREKKEDELKLLLKYVKDYGKIIDISPLYLLTDNPVMIDSLKNYEAQVNQQLTQAVASIAETVNGLAIGNSQKSSALPITLSNLPSELIVDN